jgi:hypothetical protein
VLAAAEPVDPKHPALQARIGMPVRKMFLNEETKVQEPFDGAVDDVYLNDDEEVGALEVLYHIVYDDGDEEDITLPQLFGILQDKNSIPEATRALLEQLAQAEASSAASGETAVVPWVAGVGDGAVIASGSQPAATAVAVKPEPEVRATFLRAKPPAIVSFAAWAWELYGRKQELAN